MGYSDAELLTFFLDWWLVVLVALYMLVGYVINREHSRAFDAIERHSLSFDNPSEAQRARHSAAHAEITSLQQLRYIQFWVACCAFILMAILVVLLKQQQIP
jgi:hypothetical protein